MLLICPVGVFLVFFFFSFSSPVSFAKASLNLRVQPDLFSQHDPDTFWLHIAVCLGG